MAQRKSPSYPEWPVDRSVYSLFCGVGRSVTHSVLHFSRRHMERCPTGPIVSLGYPLALNCECMKGESPYNADLVLLQKMLWIGSFYSNDQLMSYFR